MEERAIKVDYATLNRWVINYSPSIAWLKPPVNFPKVISIYCLYIEVVVQNTIDPHIISLCIIK